MTVLRVGVRGIGLLGPGLSHWMAGAEILRGSAPYAAASTVLPPPERLPPAERRRSGACVKLAMAVADQAIAQAGLDPSTLATVFTSSSGEGNNCHVLCETLATAQPLVSPTRFTNSVHNAASGYWHIAVASRASSTSLCAFDGSFGAGLIEAATSVVVQNQPVLLVASDSPYPEPLHNKRPLPDHLGLALMLAPASDPQSCAWLNIELSDATNELSTCAEPALDALRRAIPAAAGLPLLQALARGGASAVDVVIDYLPALRLNIAVTNQP